MRYRVTLENTTLGSLILTKSPKGLENIAPTIKRGENHGLHTEIDVKLEFYCGGAGKEFIDEVQETQGIDGEILITIEAFCGCEPGVEAPDYSIDYSDDYGSIIGGDCSEDFEDFYLGTLDLKTWTVDDIFTKVNIIPRGILQTVKNRLDTKVDLFTTETLDGTTVAPLTYGPYDLTLHSKLINFTSEFIQDDTRLVLDRDPGPGLSIGDLFAYPLTAPFKYELDETREPSDFEPGIDYPIFYSGAFYPAGQTIRTIEMTGNLVYDVLWFGVSFELYAEARNSAGSIIQTEGLGFFSFDEITVQTASKNEVVNFSFDMPVDSKLYIYFRILNPSASVTRRMYIEFDPSSTITIQENSTYPETETKAFGIFETGAIISRFITDQEDSFRSEYFGRKNSEPYSYSSNGCGSLRAFTNGFLMRGFPTTGDDARTIRMSMNDYFRGLNPIDNLGMGIEKDGDNYYVTVDQKSYFYDVGGVMLRLDNVPNLKRSEAPEYYHNRVKVGYEKWQIEFSNGLDEFNSVREFDTGIKAVNNELNLISPLVTSGYRLEIARRKQYGDSFTEDSEYDEDNYLVCLNRTVDGSDIPTMMDVCEKDENFDQVNNVISPETSYNLRLSPMRNMLRHSPVINSGLTKYVAREIKLTSGEGNYKMTSEFSADTCPGRWNNNLISEGANVQWDDADNSDYLPIWLPEILEFQYPLTYNEWKDIVSNPKGVFEVSESDEDHIKAFILDLKYKPGDVSDFKLLRAYV